MLTKREASAALGVSERAVNRYVAKGKLTVSYRKRASGSQEALFDEEEVERLKAKMEAPPPPQSKAETALTRRDKGQAVAAVTVVEQLAARLSEISRPSVVPVEAKLMLTLAEAAQLAGLSRGLLLEAIREGRLKGQKLGRGWKVKRSDLEKWVARL